MPHSDDDRRKNAAVNNTPQDTDPSENAPQRALPAGGESGILPGQFVRNPAEPDWGLGQVQSAIGTRITVNFENAGKVTINAAVVPLLPARE